MESTVRSRELGRRLRAVQEFSGHKGYELAEKLRWDHSMLSRTYTGHRVPNDREVATILGLCGAVGPEHDDIVQLCYPHQDTALRLPLDKAWAIFLMQARDTVRFVGFEPAIVPWPLQTPDYTRALFGDAAPLDEEWLAARREAVRLLRVADVELFVHEWALRAPVGNDAVLTEQLQHLLRISTWSDISIRLVPMGVGAHAARVGAFSLIEFSKHEPVLYLENHATAALIDDCSEVSAYRSIADALNRSAPDEQRSRELIGEIVFDLPGSPASTQNTP